MSAFVSNTKHLNITQQTSLVCIADKVQIPLWCLWQRCWQEPTSEKDVCFSSCSSFFSNHIQPAVNQWAQGNTGLKLCSSLWCESNNAKPASTWMIVSLLPNVMSGRWLKQGLQPVRHRQCLPFFCVRYTNIHSFLSASAHTITHHCRNMHTHIHGCELGISRCCLLESVVTSSLRNTLVQSCQTD